MGISTAIAITGWMVARWRYKRPLAELPVAPTTAGWHKVLTNKYYVDEAYDALIVRPLIRGSRALYKGIDQGLIDGVIIHGGARTLALFGDVLRQLQNGDVQTYVTAVVVGVAVLVAFFV
jgi:NADH-quinone oxidoreductase subunit L